MNTDNGKLDARDLAVDAEQSAIVNTPTAPLTFSMKSKNDDGLFSEKVGFGAVIRADKTDDIIEMIRRAIAAEEVRALGTFRFEVVVGGEVVLDETTIMGVNDGDDVASAAQAAISAAHPSRPRN